MFFAHSPRPEQGIPAQGYRDHIDGVSRRAKAYAEEIAPFFKNGEILRELIVSGAELHDLGKLDEQNQPILAGKKRAKRLPLPHWDAGSALLLKEGQPEDMAFFAAWLVYAHHVGLGDLGEECAKGDSLWLRDENSEHIARTDQYLEEYKTRHCTATGRTISSLQFSQWDMRGASPNLFLRIALSCLVDADHTDTAENYGESLIQKSVSLKPKERLKSLSRYIEELEIENPDSKRNRFRREMYRLCKEAKHDKGLYSCDSPVGTGKTTAIMAHLLQTAQKHDLRRVFVILPYTNIIDQSVDVYRKALVLPGEDPEAVVAALHHKAEYQDVETRRFSARWNAPIVVTTAVQFFETLAASKPAALRKLHNLPGSALFVDEAHAALPAALWPLAWRWLKEYTALWGCHAVLASGSLNKFWQIADFDEETPKIPELLPDAFREELAKSEVHRVLFKRKKGTMNEKDLCDWLLTLPGPRVLVVNTVQSAAVIARKLQEQHLDSVEHLSTALMPKDRTRTLNRVKERLKNSKDQNWTLVATSCIEAGMDFSFRTGIREAASLASLLQLAGRIRRNEEEDWPDAIIWTVELAYDGLLKAHPAFKESARILLNLMETNAISPTLCTKALDKEVKAKGSFKQDLINAEEALSFNDVANKFKVIDSDTKTIVVDQLLAKNLESGKYVNWKDIQNGSVQAWTQKIEKLNLKESIHYPEIYIWPYEYDNFVGYMAGILKMAETDQKGFGLL